LWHHLATERVGWDVVDERLLPVDRHDGDQLAVAPLELIVTRDVHLVQVETELLAQLEQRRARAVAEMAPGSVVEDDRFGYG
jgi:hypothetical protein